MTVTSTDLMIQYLLEKWIHAIYAVNILHTGQWYYYDITLPYPKRLIISKNSKLFSCLLFQSEIQNCTKKQWSNKVFSAG